MFIDLLANDNNVSYNVKLAQLLGLHVAVYISEILNIFNKAQRKNKLTEDGYFKLVRRYMTERTTLQQQEQVEIEKLLSQLNILSIHPSDSALLRVDINMLASIAANDSIQLVSDVAEIVNKNVKKNPKESKRQKVIQDLKDFVICSNDELLQSYHDWIDAIYSSPNGYLSRKAITLFQTTLNNYAKGDLDLALAILNVATIQGYKDANWAINSYLKNEHISKQYMSPAKRKEEATNSTLINTPPVLSGEVF